MGRALASIRQKLAERASYRIALLLFTVLLLAILFTYPLVLSPARSLASTWGDTRLNIWEICWPIHELLNDPLSLYHGNIFFPARNSLAFSDNMLSNSLLVLPVFLLTRNPILTYNFLLFASLLLAGLGIYLLAHQLTGSYYAAMVAALLYCFSATRMERMSQIQLFTAHWTPFALFYLHRFLETYSFRNLLLFAIFFILQALAGAYNTVYLVSAIAIGIPFLVIVEKRYKDRELYKKLFLFACVSGGILLPFFWPYVENANTYGMLRHSWAIAKFSPDLRAYFAIPTNFYSWLAKQLGLSSYLFSQPPFLFAGIIPFVLALLGVWRRKLSSSQVYYIILALFALIASAGSKLYFYDLLYKWFLLYRMTRVPSRYILLFILCLSLLSAFGIRVLLQRYQETRKKAYIVLAILLPLLFLGESYTGPLRLYNLSENKEVYRWLANENPGTVVTEIPFSNPENSIYMLSSIFHWQTLTNGYSGYNPPSYNEMKNGLEDFPNKAGIRKLCETTDYLILHGDMLSSQQQKTFFSKLPNFQDWLEPRNRFGADYVYRIKTNVTDSSFRRYFTSTALKDHAISVLLQSVAEHPELQQYVSIFINEALLQAVPLDRFFQKHVLFIPERNIQRGPNQLSFLYSYKRQKQPDERYRIGGTSVLSPVDLIVESSGPASGSRARIIVNGTNVSGSRRGYNIVVLDARSGVIENSEVFETHSGEKSLEAIRDFLMQVPQGKIVVVTARGDVSGFAGSDLIDSLKLIGATSASLPKHRESHIVIGVKGAAPGQAIEKTSKELTRQVIGEEIKGLGFHLRDLSLTSANR